MVSTSRGIMYRSGDMVLDDSVRKLVSSLDIEIYGGDYKVNFRGGLLDIFPVTEDTKLEYVGIQKINSGSIVEFSGRRVRITGMSGVDSRIREVRLYSSREAYEKEGR